MHKAIIRQAAPLFSGLQKGLCSVYELNSPITDCFRIFFENLAAHSIISDIPKILSVDQPAMMLGI
jgi:hypothetical protein